NPDRSKLSKRQGDVAVEDYIRKGYSSDAIVNFVALLGWNEGEGSEKEVYSMQELIDRFSLERVGKAGAIFNVDKLNWLEKQYIKERPAEKLVQSIRPTLHTELEKRGTMMPLDRITSDEYLTSVVELMRERVGFEHEFVTFSSYFFFEPESYEEEGLKKRWNADTNDLLREFLPYLESLEVFSSENIETCLKEFVAPKGLKAAAIIHPLRLLTSGFSFGPSLYHMLEVLGKETVIRRVLHGIEKITVPA
ncbi:MAG: glutamate--tRNA ligase, partial [Chlorobiaceae bacterium]|nr:glutamate--tRNA ligase [Chlorobiaceae bacterium]